MKKRHVSDSLRLHAFFRPRSVAVIGASHRPESVGYGVLKNLLTGGVFASKYARPFRGKVFAVNPNRKKILGKKCFASVLDIADPVDLAVVCVPSAVVLSVVRQCAQKGVRACIVISAGFGEAGNSGLQNEVLASAGSMRILGPNTLGVIRPSARLNASFGLTTPAPGRIAFLTQSGALADSVIDWAIEEQFAFSSIVSLGNAADVDLADWIRFHAEDPQTRVICCYVEGVSDGRKFLEALAYARKKKKPVLILKAGQSASGQEAAQTHTGSLAGSYAVFKGAVRQAGALLVETLPDLFLMAKALDDCPLPKQNAFAVVSNAGGVAVLLTDFCERYGVNLVSLDESVLKKLDQTGLMHPAYSRRNPLDLVGDATPARYRAALDVLLSEPSVSGLIVAQTLQTMTDASANARLVVAAKKHGKPLLTVFLGGKYSRKSIQYLNAHRVADFNDPQAAVKAAAALLFFAASFKT